MLIWKPRLITIILLFGIAQATLANSPVMKGLQITIRFKGAGSAYIYRELEKAAMRAGLSCTPTDAEYEQGRMTGKNGKILKKRNYMKCTAKPAGNITAYTIFPGEIDIDVTNNPQIESIVKDVEATLTGDSFVTSIVQVDGSLDIAAKIK